MAGNLGCLRFVRASLRMECGDRTAGISKAGRQALLDTSLCHSLFAPKLDGISNSFEIIGKIRAMLPAAPEALTDNF